MEPITIITTALALASPYLAKTGEKVAEKIGEDVWNMLKKPFKKDKKKELFPESPNETQLEKIKEELLLKVQNNDSFKNELLQTITEAKTNLNQQNINNQGKVEKQINIQTNTGDIKF
ncbi:MULTISPECIES: hypothetical protein [Flavobacteriaceae]|jgi:hypothetical protein|uniref:Uncharacterized protein n=1 Tax=Olleya marilimosa TaxID=272164 RepID=A0ABR8LUK1_9FLAO|nr:MULTISPECIES: hypothetical protein [Flavobacteriaceae]MBD3863500.1 hypothetical protein [Olleya marilimosa]MBD3891257.1 hypothetical protein [Olleya marilimosa]MDO7171818.1 hypothetical protein [Mariniflexile sp. AS56]